MLFMVFPQPGIAAKPRIITAKSKVLGIISLLEKRLSDPQVGSFTQDVLKGLRLTETEC
jgi:hypothetical protein